MAIFHDHKLLDKVENSKLVGLMLDRTNFYAEQGGQESDTGIISLIEEAGERFVVEEVQVYKGYIIHIGRLVNGKGLSVGDGVLCEYDVVFSYVCLFFSYLGEEGFNKE